MLEQKDIIFKVKKQQYPPRSYWVTAGAGLVMHGVKLETRDIDMGCTSELADKLIQNGVKWWRLEDGTRKIKMDDNMELFENWFVDEIIEMGGLYVASLASIRKQKVALNREKDWEDIRLIDAFLASQNSAQFI